MPGIELARPPYLGHHHDRLTWNGFEELPKNLLANTVTVEVGRIGCVEARFPSSLLKGQMKSILRNFDLGDSECLPSSAAAPPLPRCATQHLSWYHRLPCRE